MSTSLKREQSRLRVLWHKLNNNIEKWVPWFACAWVFAFILFAHYKLGLGFWS